MFHNPYSHHHYEVPHPVNIFSYFYSFFLFTNNHNCLILIKHAPYTGDIPNGLVPGKQIYISGVVQHHADQ